MLVGRGAEVGAGPEEVSRLGGGGGWVGVVELKFEMEMEMGGKTAERVVWEALGRFGLLQNGSWEGCLQHFTMKGVVLGGKGKEGFELGYGTCG